MNPSNITYCLMNYTVQCKDIVSGQYGCFLFDMAHWKNTGEFKAIGPVFPSLSLFYAWDNANGHNRQSGYWERNH